MSEYIQIGVTAMRNRATGGFEPAVPLYIEATSANVESQKKMMEDIGRLFAARMKAEAREAGKA